VKEEQLQDLSQVKANYQVPAELQSCHTAIVDGYIIEGHVPAADIDRLLAEHPQIAGLAVPGMPVGAPGMNVQGMEPEQYDVIAFDKQGQTSIFASYPAGEKP
jgi:hypothetical protein